MKYYLFQFLCSITPSIHNIIKYQSTHEEERSGTEERKLSKKNQKTNLEIDQMYKQPERDLENNSDDTQGKKWTKLLIDGNFQQQEDIFFKRIQIRILYMNNRCEKLRIHLMD